MIEQFERARKRATPLISVQTQNWQGTWRKLSKVQVREIPDPAVLWNFIKGTTAINTEGQQIMSLFVDSAGEDVTKGNPVAFLTALAGIDSKISAMCFFVLPRDILSGEGADGAMLQAISNLRDPLKAAGASLVILSADIEFPPFLQQDIITYTDPLPDAEALTSIVRDAHKTFNLDAPDEKTELKAVDALRGLSDFSAEQAAFMCISKEGLDLDMLWNQKREMINQTKGLSVWEGKQKYDAVGQCESVKGFITDIFNGKDAPRTIVWIDEIEKFVGSAGGDRSGTSSDQLAVFLKEMQDRGYIGIILVGHPGTGKSFIAQTSGAEFGVPTLAMDTGGAKGNGLVGQAENAIRNAFRVIHAVSGGKALFIATSNGIGGIPPELKRRFNMGTYFFDLPNDAGTEQLWDIYRAKYEISEDIPKGVESWTGSDIRNACDIAWRTNKPLTEAILRITPIIKSDPEGIKRLCKEAHGRYLDASRMGVYQINKVQEEALKRNIPEWAKAG